MVRIIRCPDFPLTAFMRSHLESRFTCEFEDYRRYVSLMEASVRLSRRNAREGEDVRVHVPVASRGVEIGEVTAPSLDAHVAIDMAARRPRRQVGRHRKSEPGGRRQPAYAWSRPASENG